ncbi:MAG: group III truncated hemoglobin [Beijerinckiaceae bacterium]
MIDTSNQPSMDLTERAERRAAITRDIQAATGLDEAVLEKLVRAFYGAARHDEILGPSFDGVLDWEKHIATITAFWSSVALLTGSYSGRPLAAHLPLDLQPRHFARWLALFERTARDVCPAEGAALLIEKAERIAKSLEIGAAVHRGELPGLPGMV